jgi:signal transduction histidine kinase
MTIEPVLFTRRIGIFSSVAIILIGIIGILGWITGIYMTFDITGVVPISPVAAIAYIFLGLIMLIIAIPLKGAFARLTAKIAVSMIMIIGCFFWMTAAFFPSLDIQKIVVTPLVGAGSPVETEIAPLAAFAIFLGTVALTRMIYKKIKWRHYETVVGILGTVVFSIGFLSIIGYAFGSPELYGGSVRAVSFSSSIALLFFGIGIIALNGTTNWPSSVFSRNTVSAQMIRILIPIIVIAFLSFSWMLFRVIIPSSSNPVFLVAIFTALSVASVAYTVSFVSGRIQRIVESAQNEKTEAIKSLAAANKKLEILDSLTRHDVLNQITLASIEADLVSRNTKDLRVLESAESITKINKTIIALLQFSKEYKQVGIEEPRWLNLNELISDAIDQLDFGKVAVDYYCEDLRVYADPMIEKAFFNILDNSLRHGDRITKVLINCAVSKKDGTLSIIFSDNGVGVPEDEKEKIFEKDVGKNTGLGLFLVRQILSITGISILENGIPGKGARFEIIVPKDHFNDGAQSGDNQKAGTANQKDE